MIWLPNRAGSHWHSLPRAGEPALWLDRGSLGLHAVAARRFSVVRSSSVPFWSADTVGWPLRKQGRKERSSDNHDGGVRQTRYSVGQQGPIAAQEGLQESDIHKFHLIWLEFCVIIHYGGVLGSHGPRKGKRLQSNLDLGIRYRYIVLVSISMTLDTVSIRLTTRNAISILAHKIIEISTRVVVATIRFALRTWLR